MSQLLADASAIVILALIVAAGYVAIWSDDAFRREDCYKVLRLLLIAGASGGLALNLHQLALALHQAGLIGWLHCPPGDPAGRRTPDRRPGAARSHTDRSLSWSESLELTIEYMAGAWIEIPDEWGWGPTRVLRTELKAAGYWTEEWRGVDGVMIWVTGDKIELDREPPDHCPDAWLAKSWMSWTQTGGADASST